MTIPTEPIGSIPRPPELIHACAAQLSPERLDEIARAAVRDTLQRFEATGSPVRDPPILVPPVRGDADLLSCPSGDLQR